MMSNTSSSEPQQRYTFSERPRQAPVGWRVMNAAREIPGSSVFEDGRYQSKAWKGDFIKGTHYSAIDPEDEMAHVWLVTCASLDACELAFISEQQAFDAALRWYQASEYAAEIDELDLSQDDNRRWVIWRGFELLNSGEVTL
jgi:hypothetical protein